MYSNKQRKDQILPRQPYEPDSRAP
uniref:Uncharacterized protein n=1 Tax=Rhizophora mucronata TaxID=61149 RepID=A0A2P2NUS1_RHIMU